MPQHIGHAIFSDTNISQGSVAIPFTCKICNDIFIANSLSSVTLTVEEFWKSANSQYLAKLWTRVWCLVFWLTVYVTSLKRFILIWELIVITHLRQCGFSSQYRRRFHAPATPPVNRLRDLVVSRQQAASRFLASAFPQTYAVTIQKYRINFVVISLSLLFTIRLRNKHERNNNWRLYCSR